MSRADPAFMDTAAYFVRGRLRGTVMPDHNSMDRTEWLRSWHGVPIRVRNARLLDPPPTLDSHGFELIRVESAADSQQDIGKRRDSYCEESKRIVEALTGCGKSRALNQVYRGGFHGLRPGDQLDPEAPDAGTVTHYVERAHTDISPWVELQPEWKAFAQDRHGAIYNVWRSTDLRRPVERDPLAVCHSRNVAPQDMVAAWTYRLLPDGGDFLGYNLAFDAFQQWYYYPRMGPDEALVLKLYDTREEMGCRRGVFHTAVRDPGAPPGARCRESADIRVGAVFDNETEQAARRARFLAELPPVPGKLRHARGALGEKASGAA